MRLVTFEMDVLSVIGRGTAAAFLVVSAVRDLDPMSAIAAFVAIAVTEYVVRGNRVDSVRPPRGLRY